MCFRLPLDKFELIRKEDLGKHQLKFDQMRKNLSTEGHYSEDSETGYIFCADLEFPEAAQEKLLAFPLAPEGMIVDEDLLSQGQKEIWSSLYKSPYYTTTHRKMVNSFSKKKGYTSHYQYLKFLSSLGVKIKLKRGYMFRQKKFISSYVKYCAQQRKLSTNPADKQMWKDLCNIIFGMLDIRRVTFTHYLIVGCSFPKISSQIISGKTIEDVTRRVNIKFFNTVQKMEACLKNHVESMPRVINENLVQVPLYTIILKSTRTVLG